MLIVGLTGGIGVGKTTVSNLFEELGVPVIDADVIAHELTQGETIALKKIEEYFGPQIIQNGSLNRKYLAEIIHQDKAKKLWLEQCLHPLIRDEIIKQISLIQAPYCIIVIPLLRESKSFSYINRILVVDAPLDLQIKRVKDRDRLNKEQILNIINNQASREDRLKIADDIITNTGSLDSLKEQVLKLHDVYLKISSNYQ